MATKKFTELPEDLTPDDADIVAVVDSSTGTSSKMTRGNFLTGKITTSDVTFENLNGNGDVGVGATQVSQGDHTHDDRYYTETEMDGSLAGKSNTGHTHTEANITDLDKYSQSAADALLAGKSDTAHTHDTRYYTEAEADGLLAGKSNTGHTHVEANITDLDKYSQSAADALLAGKSDTAHTHDDRYYTESESDGLLAGKSDTGHTHTEANITDLDKYSQSAADALLAGKSNTGHTHTEANITDLDHDAQKIKSKSVDAPLAGDDGKVLQYDHINNKFILAPGGGAIDHNDTGSLDTGDYQHLTQTEHDTLVGGGDAGALHNHGGQYYTETEMDGSLAGKSNTGHTHVEANITDLDKYSQSAADALLAGKSDTAHTHDGRYYTETEADGFLAGKSNTGHTHTEANITDLDHDAQKIKSKSVDAPLAGDDTKVLQYDHGNNKFILAAGGGGVIDHNDLTAIQGGGVGEYYHMTNTQHTAATRNATNAVNGLMPSGKLNNWDAASTHAGSVGNPHSVSLEEARSDGNIMTGPIVFNPPANMTVIDISASNKDLVWMLGHNTNSYGYYWKYVGTGSGNANYLYLYSENGSGADFYHFRYHQINHQIDVNSDLNMENGHLVDGRDVSADGTTLDALAGHTHDDRYYTESEADGFLAGKSNTGHTHTEANITDLDHDAQKIKSKPVDAPIATDDGKVLQYDHPNNKFILASGGGAAIDHNDTGSLDTGDYQHLTQAEHDTLVGGGDAGALHDHGGQYYTETEADGLLASKSNTGHTHVEANITDLDKYSQSAADALLAGKSDTSHTHDGRYYTETEIDVNIDQAVKVASSPTFVGANLTGLLQIIKYAETVYAVGSIGVNTALDFNNGPVQTMTITGDLTLSFTNWPHATKSCSMVLVITNGGAHALTWPAAVDWAGGTTPSLTASGRDRLVLVSEDNGTTIEGFESGLDMK